MSILLIRHEGDGTVLLALQVDGGLVGPLRLDKTCLIDELAFVRPYEVGTWIKLPGQVVGDDNLQSQG